MRALVIAPQPFFSYRGTPFSVYYRTLIAAEIGLPSDLLTYGQGIDVNLPGCRIYRIPALRWLGNVKIGPSVLKAMLDVLMIVRTITLLARRRYEIVHAHEEAVIWCTWLKPLFRFRLIYDMHSSLPQQLDNFRYVRLPFVRRLFTRFERRAVEASDAVITVCPALRDHAKSLTPEHHKVFLIENSIVDPVQGRSHETPDIAAVARAATAREWLAGRRAATTLIYAGTLEAYQGIDRLLDAFSVVRQSLPDASLLVVGGQPGQVEEFRRRADRLGIGGSVYFAGLLSHSHAHELVRLCAAAISPRITGTNTPLKIYELIADQVPLLATRIVSHTQVLSDEICTLIGVEPGEMAGDIVRAMQDPGRLQQKARAAAVWYRDNYSRERYSTKLRALIAFVAA